MNNQLSQKIPELIRVFELSIIDLAVKLKNDHGTLSAEDLEDTHYVIGMVRTNAVSLQMALELGDSYYSANTEKVDRLIAEATALAESLKSEGFGKSRFSLGQITATPGVLQVLAENYTLPSDVLARHATGDFGDLDPDDIQRNIEALHDGSRIFSAYNLAEDGGKVWVITEAEDDNGVRSHTTILLPEEY